MHERIAAAIGALRKISRQDVHAGRLSLRVLALRGRKRIMISSLKEGDNLGTDLE